jgi:HK97 family phage portal protein
MNNIFSQLFQFREAPQPPSGFTPGVPHSTDPRDPSNQPPKGGNWEANVVRPIGRTSLLVPAWYRGVSLIMQTMGQMITQYQRKTADGGNFIEDRYGKNGELNWLLQVRPNPLMTASQLQEQIEYRKIYYGNAYVYIERGLDGYPKNLWLCTGGSYNPLMDTYTLVYNTEHGVRLKVMTDSQNVLHFKNVFMSEDFYMGLPTLEFAFKALSIAATADEQALQDVAKGGKHKVLIQEQQSQTTGTRGRANQNELKKMKEQFAQDWMANDVALLDNVADAKIISQTSQQLQLLENRSFQVSDLARILGIPRIMMMEDAGSSYKMPEHATQEFLLRTVQPRIREWEDELNSKLLTPRDFGKRRIHVCELALRRLDAKGQADIDKIHLETGWSPNEIRAQYDLPSIKEGDAHYVSTNLAEVGSEKLRSAGGRPAEPTTPAPTPQGEGEE